MDDVTLRFLDKDGAVVQSSGWSAVPNNQRPLWCRDGLTDEQRQALQQPGVSTPVVSDPAEVARVGFGDEAVVLRVARYGFSMQTMVSSANAPDDVLRAFPSRDEPEPVNWSAADKFGVFFGSVVPEALSVELAFDDGTMEIVPATAAPPDVDTQLRFWMATISGKPLLYRVRVLDEDGTLIDQVNVRARKGLALAP